MSTIDIDTSTEVLTVEQVAESCAPAAKGYMQPASGEPLVARQAFPASRSATPATHEPYPASACGVASSLEYETDHVPAQTGSQAPAPVGVQMESTRWFALPVANAANRPARTRSRQRAHRFLGAHHLARPRAR